MSSHSNDTETLWEFPKLSYEAIVALMDVAGLRKCTRTVVINQSLQCEAMISDALSHGGDFEIWKPGAHKASEIEFDNTISPKCSIQVNLSQKTLAALTLCLNRGHESPEHALNIALQRWRVVAINEHEGGSVYLRKSASDTLNPVEFLSF